MTAVEFAPGTTLIREADRPSDLPIIHNGPPGTFVLFPNGLRVSLPTDQIVGAEDNGRRVRVSFGGMQFDGLVDGQLIFTRVRELHDEARLSPERSRTMQLAPDWVTSILVHGRRVWPFLVFKIVPASLWHSSQASGFFAGSPVDERDGFIHFSTAAQLPETARRHFAGVEGLVIVAVPVDALDLRWEPSRGGDLFPHLYSPLRLGAVRWVRDLPLDASGQHVFPSLE